MNTTLHCPTPAPCLAPAAHDELLPLMGGRLRMHLTGKQTGGRAFVSTSVYEPGLGVPVHTHTLEDEYFHVMEGELEIVVGDAMEIVGPGASAFLPRGVPHAWKVTGDRPAKFLLTVTPAGMEDMFRQLADLPPGEPDLRQIEQICRRYGIAFAGN